MRNTLHAKKRAIERYGIELDRLTIDYIKKCIKANKCKEIHTQNGGRKIYRVFVKEKWIRVIYKKGCDKIITVLEDKDADNYKGDIK